MGRVKERKIIMLYTRPTYFELEFTRNAYSFEWFKWWKHYYFFTYFLPSL